jgi:hypothetical protein
MRAAYPDNIFPLAGCRNGSDLIINEESCSDYRGIPDPSAHLESHTACGAGSAEISAGVQGNHSDRIMVEVAAQIKNIIMGAMTL